MLNFDGEEPIVHFQVTLSGESTGPPAEIHIPLADYLALARRSRSLEELRTLIFEWTPEKARAASA